MPRYTDDSIDRVRDAIDMVDLVGAKTELRRAGAARLEGLCPFHDERTPSFGIDPVKKLYHCFGCGAGGDAISFVRETEGLDFIGAIELLADRFGVELVVAEEDPDAARRRAERERLLSLLERTAAFYERVLWESPEAASARSYLVSRGLSEEALRVFRVGYSPSAWDRVLLGSRRAGFSNQELYETGLATRGREGRLYDRFRGRIMFPLWDARGRVIGFGGRAMGEDRGAKYINTPESKLFHKGNELYAAHLARPSAAKAREVVVVEGYTDVIALHQAGFENVVASMGTAMTDQQVGYLKRLAPLARLAMDADSAGQEAMLRAARTAGDELELLVVPLPEGRDPADLAQADPDALRTALSQGEEIHRFAIDRTLAKHDLSNARGKEAALRAVAPMYEGIPSGRKLLRDEALELIDSRIGIRDVNPGADVPGLLREFAQAAAREEVRRPQRPAPSDDPGGPVPQPRRLALPSALGSAGQIERNFLAQCFALPDAGADALEKIDFDEHFTEPVNRRLAEHIRRHGPASLDVEAEDDELRSALVELNARATASPPTTAMLDAQRLQLELRRVERRLRAARAAGEPVTEWARRKGKVQEELDTAVARSVESA